MCSRSSLFIEKWGSSVKSKQCYSHSKGLDMNLFTRPWRLVGAVGAILLGVGAVSVGPATAASPTALQVTLHLSGRSDSSYSCGTWALDSMSRHFTVTAVGSGVYQVEYNDYGTFVTVNNVDPGFGPYGGGSTCIPNSPTVVSGMTGPFYGGATLTVDASSPPSMSSLQANLSSGNGGASAAAFPSVVGDSPSSTQLVTDLFPANSVTSVTWGQWMWQYMLPTTHLLWIDSSS
jgi:hypothetical protein